VFNPAPGKLSDPVLMLPDSGAQL